MILERKPLDLHEVKKIIEDIDDNERKAQIELYLKKFLKTKPEQIKKIKEELKKLDLLKMKEEHVVKIVDLMPEDISDINKIFTDVNLTEDEINKILEIVKNNK